MSSSDSEEDCYGHVAQKLQKMRNIYSEDKIECTNLLNESNEIDKLLKNVEKEPEHDISTASTSMDNSQSLEDSIDAIIAKAGATKTCKTKRKTRTSQKVVSEPLPEMPPRRGRKGKKPSSTDEIRTTRGSKRGAISVQSEEAPVEQSTVNDIVPNTSRNRSTASNRRGSRGRGWGRSPRNQIQRFIEALMPIYSVGNTDEYPDECESQQLFSSAPKPSEDVVVIEENDPLEENEELSVKVHWLSSEFFKFKIRKFQKLTQIFEFFAQKENVSFENLLFMFNNRILKSDDTPDSIGYSFVKFIEGGIVNRNVSSLIQDEERKNSLGLKIKFQCQNLKKPIEISVNPDSKLSVAMIKCAEVLEQPLQKLKFVFDGESLSGKNTVEELEFEGGECIDVMIIS